MEILDPIVKPYYISTLNKELDKVELKNHFITFTIGTILEYQNIRKYTDTRHQINCMGLGFRVHKHKTKIQKDKSGDTLGPMQKLGIPEEHKYMTSQFNFIKERDKRKIKQGNIDYDKHTQGTNNQYNIKSENRNYQ